MDVKELEKMMKNDVKEAKENEVQIIHETKICGYIFKIYGTKEEPMFLAQDIAEILDYQRNTDGTPVVRKMLNILDDDEKLMFQIGSSGQIRQMWFVTEDGLYRILMRSNQPNAKQFQKQVSKILKEIRLKGGYVVEHREEEFIENHYDFLSSETKNAMLSEMREYIKKQNALIEEQNKKILSDAPKVDYHDSVLNCEKLISVNEIANDIGISAKALNQFLHNEGIQYRQGKSWKIYSKHYDLITDKYCDYHITEYGQQLKWTEKGRKFILELYYSKDKEE